ncbi:uncharacterized protein LOC124166735 [Ischnura elegans]|uniref:uncharacterized protein LOC124166735 n=1 Tax=Ischnura elegans TaxID=197161 RepID=UPI001ED89D33|nr:uncharacterized protein LOC124166735 [Ischnura elegans]
MIELNTVRMPQFNFFQPSTQMIDDSLSSSMDVIRCTQDAARVIGSIIQKTSGMKKVGNYLKGVKRKRAKETEKRKSASKRPKLPVPGLARERRPKVSKKVKRLSSDSNLRKKGMGELEDCGKYPSASDSGIDPWCSGGIDPKYWGMDWETLIPIFGLDF